ncbi:MAG: methyltransferase domain-containing protein [Acetobacteraceae bacterium]|nr:methyltransferase domain-containing protein [Acetobacteraceae bacterium]
MVLVTGLEGRVCPGMARPYCCVARGSSPAGTGGVQVPGQAPGALPPHPARPWRCRMKLDPQLERVRLTYDGAAPTYDQSYRPGAGLKGLMWEAYQTVTWKLIRDRLPSPTAGARALDAGGGTGRWAALLAREGLRLTILDLSPGMLEQARARFADLGLAPPELVEGSITSLPFPDGAFDFVLCEGDPVSYCGPQYSQAISELVRVARPGAHLVLGLDNRVAYFVDLLRSRGLAEALDHLERGIGLCPYGMEVMTFTPRMLDRELDSAGADLLEVQGKPLLTSLLLWVDRAQAERASGDEGLRARLIAAEQALLSEGYRGLGGHLHAVARKRGPA